jgi:hypothetical protein
VLLHDLQSRVLEGLFAGNQALQDEFHQALVGFEQQPQSAQYNQHALLHLEILVREDNFNLIFISSSKASEKECEQMDQLVSNYWNPILILELDET